MHLSGKANVVADALSRPEIEAITVGLQTLDYAALAEDQKTDPDCLAYKTALTALQPDRIEHVPGVRVLCDVSDGRKQPILPPNWRKQAFLLKHGLSQPSGRAT